MKTGIYHYPSGGNIVTFFLNIEKNTYSCELGYKEYDKVNGFRFNNNLWDYFINGSYVFKNHLFDTSDFEKYNVVLKYSAVKEFIFKLIFEG